MKKNFLKEFVKKRKHLWWSTKNYNQLSQEAIVEAVLNYGDWDDVQELIKILGIKTVADIFYRQAEQRRSNYDPKIKNYFKLYFDKYA